MTAAKNAGAGVTLRDLSVTFDGGIEAVASVSMDVAPGEFVAILGPSGCGKSTLLRAIAGLQRHQGHARIESNGNGGGSSETAFVFQDPNLLPWRNVLRNVALPLELAGVAKADRLPRAAEAIAAVGLGGAERRYPSQLSGGMRMRCSLARAIVTRPSLMLLDEPFAALDEISRFALNGLLRDLWAQSGMTALFVTHSVSEAVFLGTRAIVMSKRPTRIALDHPIPLPAQRTDDLRVTPEFTREVAQISAALREAAG